MQMSSAAASVANGLAMTVEQSTAAMERAKMEYLANKELLRLQKELEIIQGDTLLNKLNLAHRADRSATNVHVA